MLLMKLRNAVQRPPDPCQAATLVFRASVYNIGLMYVST
jgi:hypothetical protein